MKIVCTHLLNNFTGSPNILRNTVLSLSEENEVVLLTSKSEGFLSNLEGVKYKYNGYKWVDNKILLLI
ncbi:MAG: hypothetical protein HUJ68_13585, partial [Clostridia bacterium]|nr:hypothetical protein [Clostridia bacterium]